MMELKKYFAEELLKLENVEINGPEVENGAPHILNVSFLGVRSEVLLHTLEDMHIYVSAGRDVYKRQSKTWCSSD